MATAMTNGFPCPVLVPYIHTSHALEQVANTDQS